MNSRGVRRAAAVALLLVVTSPSDGRAQPRVANSKSIKCTFARAAAATWTKAGAPDAVVKSANLVLRFESIDTEVGTAQLRNGSVGSDVTVRLAEGYLHFMQAFRTGPLYTTTVFEAGATGTKLKAVHSRHELFTTPLPGATSSPEQYYGECEILQ
jgi:hypothetical protein